MVQMEKDKNFKKFFEDQLKKLLEDVYSKMELPLNKKKPETGGVEAVHFPNMMMRRYEVLGHIPALLVAFDFVKFQGKERKQLAQLLPYTVKMLSGKEAVGSFLAVNMLGMMTEELAGLYLTVLSSIFTFHYESRGKIGLNKEEFPSDILKQILGWVDHIFEKLERI